jgi:hypothetical protein
MARGGACHERTMLNEALDRRESEEDEPDAHSSGVRKGWQRPRPFNRFTMIMISM